MAELAGVAPNEKLGVGVAVVMAGIEVGVAVTVVATAVVVAAGVLPKENPLFKNNNK